MNIKRVALIASVLILATGAFLYWQRQPQIKNADSNGTNVIAFGDSLVYGYGATDPDKTGMFAVTSREMNVPIINKGVIGNTTSDALARIDDDVLANDPKIVFVLLGGNDYLQHMATSTTFENLATIITKIQDKGAAVILVGVQRCGIISDLCEKYYKDLSEEYHTGYVPNVLQGIITQRQYMFDSVHPNDRGYSLIAPHLENALMEVIDQAK